MLIKLIQSNLSIYTVIDNKEHLINEKLEVTKQGTT